MLAGPAADSTRSPTQEAERRMEPVVSDNLGEAKLNAARSTASGRVFLTVGESKRTAGLVPAGLNPAARLVRLAGGALWTWFNIERQLFNLADSKPFDSDRPHHG